MKPSIKGNNPDQDSSIHKTQSDHELQDSIRPAGGLLSSNIKIIEQLKKLSTCSSRQQAEEILKTLWGELLRRPDQMSDGSPSNLFIEDTWPKHLHPLLTTVIRCATGDPEAIAQMGAIHRLLHPEAFDLSRSDILEFNRKYKLSRPMIRGHNLLELIDRITPHIEAVKEPSTADADSPWENTAVLMKTAPPSVCDQPGYAYIKSFWKLGVTVRSLAIRIYLRYLEEKDEIIEARTLSRNFEDYKKWAQESGGLTLLHSAEMGSDRDLFRRIPRSYQKRSQSAG